MSCRRAARQHCPQGVRDGERLVEAVVAEQHRHPALAVGVRRGGNFGQLGPGRLGREQSGAEAGGGGNDAQVVQERRVDDVVEGRCVRGEVGGRSGCRQGQEVALLPVDRSPLDAGLASIADSVQELAGGVGLQPELVAGVDPHETGQQRRACGRVRGAKVARQAQRDNRLGPLA